MRKIFTLSIIGVVLVGLVFLALSSCGDHKASFDTSTVGSSKQDSTYGAWWEHMWSLPDKNSSNKKNNPRKNSVTKFSNDDNKK